MKFLYGSIFLQNELNLLEKLSELSKSSNDMQNDILKFTVIEHVIDNQYIMLNQSKTSNLLISNLPTVFKLIDKCILFEYKPSELDKLNTFVSSFSTFKSTYYNTELCIVKLDDLLTDEPTFVEFIESYNFKNLF